MLVNGSWLVFFLGTFGGFLGELLKWYRLREKPELPQYASSPFYWCVTLLLILAGGGLAVCYGTEEVNALLAVNIGVSAPLIIQSLSNTLDAVQGGDEVSLRQSGKRRHSGDHWAHSDEHELANHDPDSFGAALDNDETTEDATPEGAANDRQVSDRQHYQWSLFRRFLAG